MRELVDARKRKLSRDDALRLARDASKIIIAKGKRITTFDMCAAPPDETTVLKHLLGPTGNLRAPTILKGDTLLVGFNDDVYRETLG